MNYKDNGVIYKLSEVNVNNKNIIINNLKEYTQTKGFEVGESQLVAWEACLDFLIKQYTRLSKQIKSYDVTCIFEYILPLEGGRRPDVIMLFKEKVVILEFKNKNSYREDDVLQAIGYREDIYNYHKYTRENKLKVESYLVLTKGNLSHKVNGLQILNNENFLYYIGFNSLSEANMLESIEFISSDYEPLPDILTATYELFENGSLPYIQNILDGDIEKAYKTLQKIVLNNINNNKGKKIVFISGVPGAGKTLVALKFLYNYNKYIKENMPNEGGALYLSGNGPLVNVIESQIDKALEDKGEDRGKGKAYIKGAIDFKKEYMNNNKVPNYNVILFDEAQRAWDEKKMNLGDLTEPKVLLDICDKIYDKKKNITLVCFVGNGQSIHEGEEKGIKLWADTLKYRYDYSVYLPYIYEDDFKHISNLIKVNELHLDVSIRNNFIDISKFVESVLSCDKDGVRIELNKMKEKGFIIKISRDFSKCVSYLKNLDNDKLNYGLLISSKVRDNYMFNTKKALGKDNFNSYIKKNEAGRWFLNECKNLDNAASEFACQGLEIDIPVVIFGGDYFIKNGKFYFDESNIKKQLEKYDNPEKIMESIYRVLLTRSRKGMLLFIPENRDLDETYNFFIDVGVNMF